MEKQELMKIATNVQNVERLKELEPQIITAVNDAVMNSVMFTGIDREKMQEITNKCVNAFAQVLKSEFGALDDEVIKTLERIRTVSERTVQRDKQKNKKS